MVDWRTCARFHLQTMMGIFSFESNSPKDRRTPSQQDLMDQSSRCLEKSERLVTPLDCAETPLSTLNWNVSQVISNSNSPIEFCLHLTMSFTVSPFWKVYGLESAIVQVSWLILTTKVDLGKLQEFQAWTTNFITSRKILISWKSDRYTPSAEQNFPERRVQWLVDLGGR